ncbi:hypothetical protein DL769_001548 [Monosporascus sp. CRB-8-3]|nr:hypothetical protein DL769_001548 [Monosporascus sp. CRB-8-3]
MAGLPNSEASPSILLKTLGSTRRPLPTLPIKADFTLVPGSQTAAASATAALSAMACTTVGPGHRGYVLSGTCKTNWDYDANVELGVLSSPRGRCSRARPGRWPAFAPRATGALDQQNRALAAAARTLNLLAPVWVGAFHHMLLGGMVEAFVPDGWVFGARGSKVAIAFLCLGARAVVAGVACQQVYVLVFATFAARFHYVAARLKRKKYALPMFRPWATTLATLYLSLALLTARKVFRLAQLAGGREYRGNPPVAHVLFDAFPVGAAAWLRTSFTPGERHWAGPEGDGITSSSRLHPLRRGGVSEMQGMRVLLSF